MCDAGGPEPTYLVEFDSQRHPKWRDDLYRQSPELNPPAHL